jgi:hypothetical protein
MQAVQLWSSIVETRRALSRAKRDGESNLVIEEMNKKIRRLRDELHSLKDVPGFSEEQVKKVLAKINENRCRNKFIQNGSVRQPKNSSDKKEDAKKGDFTEYTSNPDKYGQVMLVCGW